MKLERNTGIIHYVMVNHMWVFTIWLIPISILYDFLWWIHAKYTYWVNLRRPSIRHEAKVILPKMVKPLKLLRNIVGN